MSSQSNIKHNLKYKKKLEKINKRIHRIEKILSTYIDDNNEVEMPLNLNKITHKNINKEKSIKYTKSLIKKLNERKVKIIIKKEVNEEFEIPPLEYVI